MITFYDLSSVDQGKAWSCNTWKARYSLNYKGLPYKTEWVEYPEIEPLFKKLGVPPTGKKPDGTDYYTVPAIYDDSTGAYVSESILIAKYLDKTYPDLPKLFPNETDAFHFVFDEAFFPTTLAKWPFIIPIVYKQLNPASQPYFKFTRELFFGKKLEELTPTGEEGVVEWKKYQDGLGTVDKWYKNNSGTGPFLLGDTISYADIIVASHLVWWKILVGEDGQQWKDVSSWHDGRWGKLVKALEKYQVVH